MLRDWSDDDRVVELDDEAVRFDQVRDDPVADWRERLDPDENRLRQERPPHWDT